MIPILYAYGETEFTSNGIGRLTDIISCEVTEDESCMYECEFQYPMTGAHFDDIVEGNIIYAIHDDTKTPQPFDIYNHSAPIDGVVTFYARHASYRTNNVIIAPFSAESISGAFVGLKSHEIQESPFEYWTDKSSLGTFHIDAPISVRKVLAGTAGSILDAFGGGDYEFDHFIIKLYQHRGADNNVYIRYGKNMVSMTHDVDASSLFNAAVPYWQKEDPVTGDVTLVTVEGYIVRATSAPSGDPTVAVEMDFTEYFTDAPTEAQLASAALSYLETNKPWEIKASIEVDFVALWQTEEYKNVAPLQRVGLYDKVNVVHSGLGLQTKMQVVSVTYNVLTERFDRMELGDAKLSYGQVVTQDVEQKIKEDVPSKSSMAEAIEQATKMIQGGLGGHVVISTSEDGMPEEILIMDAENKNDATNVLRINMAGIGFSTTGYNGPFSTAWTLDGHFDAKWINTGTLDASLITAGVLRDKNDRFYLDLGSGTFKFNADSLDNATIGGKKLATQDAVEESIANTASELSNRIGTNEADIAQYKQWISFDTTNGLMIGSTQTGYRIQIKGDEIGFYNGAIRMGYLSNQQLFIKDTQVQQSLKFGVNDASPDWAFVPRTNGNLSFRYIGG